jgi:uncharacterized membrane protein (UPF0127 family)
MPPRPIPRAIRAAVLIVLVTASACASAENPSIDRGTVTMPNGTVYTVEIPRTPEARERGLMFRSSLAPRTGMLFVFDTTTQHAFWMKNCLIPLDLIWLDETKRVVAILPDTPPCKADPCPIYQIASPSRYVLEIVGGAAKHEDVVAGSVLKF